MSNNINILNRVNHLGNVSISLIRNFLCCLPSPHSEIYECERRIVAISTVI